MKQGYKIKTRKTLLFCLILAVAGIGIQACTQDFEMDSISIEQTARLQLNAEDFADFLDYYHDFETHRRINAVYGGSFEPLVDISSPSLRGSTIDAKTAISSLLNKDRVFQFDGKVVFVNEDFSVIKGIDATDYDAFLRSRPANTLNIPESIVIAKVGFRGNGSDSFTRGTPWRERDCLMCGLRGIAFAATWWLGIPNAAGDLVGACVGCAERIWILGRDTFHRFFGSCPPPAEDNPLKIVPNPDFCGSYFLCDFGVAHLMFCPDGLYFCEEIGTCSWSWDANCTFDCLAG